MRRVTYATEDGRIMSQEHQFAGRSGKATLYKFRSFQTPEQRAFVREILVEHKVYFARSSQLNDPFDMSPKFEEFTRDGLLKAATAFWSRQPQGGGDEGRAQIEHLRTCDLDKHTAIAEAKTRDRMERGYPIFSLAGNRDHPMLWSHYGAGHTGLCIHFRSDEQSIFGMSLKVTYSNRRALIPTDIRSVSEQEIFERIALHKGEFWEYEDEYRWCHFPDTDYSDLPIRFNGQYAHFDAALLSGITVGVRMPDAHASDVLNLAGAHDPVLPVWRAKETRDFTFTFEQIG